MRHFVTATFLLLLASPALATDPDILINGGTLDFDYTGAVNGHFGSSGSLVADPPTEGTVATTYVLDGLNYLVVAGALENGANFVDGGVVIVHSAAPITPGVYPLDGINGLFVFVDDAVGWVPPADPFNVNWTNEFAAIVAAGKYGSVSGSVTLNTVSSTLISGTFHATVVDPDTFTTLSITDGAFNVETTTAVDGTSWARVKTLYR